MNQALENEKARARIWEQMAKRVCEANNFSVSQTDNVFYLAREIDISSFTAGEKAGREAAVEELFKIEKEKWSDAVHCTCLGYALVELAGGEESEGGKKMEAALKADTSDNK